MKIIRILFFFLVSFFTATNCRAQDSSNVYTYGGTNNDYAREIISTSDSGFIVVGTTGSFGVELTDIYIIKTDRYGVKEWSHLYGTEGIDWGYGIRETPDNGYIVTGYTNQASGMGYDIYLLKISSIGEVQWSKNIGGPDWDFGYAIEVTADSGFIICGKTYSFTNGGADGYLVKTDRDGNVVWQKNYGGTGNESFNDIIRDRDSNYGLVGETSSIGWGWYDEWLLRCDGNGDTLWAEVYGSVLFDAGYAIDTTADGGYVTNGSSNSYGGADTTYNMMLIKTGQAGNWMWTRLHGDANKYEAGYIVDVFPNGDIFDGGITDAFGLGKTSFYIIRSDSLGNYITGANPGGTEREEGYSVAVGKHNQVLFAGISDSYGCGQFDVYLIRIDSFAFQSHHPPIFHHTCDTTIGIAEIGSQQNPLQIFPNPATDIISIDFEPISITDGNYSVVFTDLSGKEIMLVETKKFPVDLSTSALSNGFYIVSIFDDHQLVAKQKLVVH